MRQSGVGLIRRDAVAVAEILRDLPPSGIVVVPNDVEKLLSVRVVRNIWVAVDHVEREILKIRHSDHPSHTQDFHFDCSSDSCPCGSVADSGSGSQGCRTAR